MAQVANKYNVLKPETGNWLTDYTHVGVSRGGIMPKGSNIIDRMDLHYVDGSSDKVYICILSQEGFTYYVEGWYGRRGNYTLQNQSKYEGQSEAVARKEFEKLHFSKEKKQYKVIGSAKGKAEEVQRSNSSAFKERVVWPQNAQPLKEGKKKQEIIDSDDWIAEEKEDGVRLTIHVTPQGLRWFSRSPGVADPTRPLEKTQAFGFLSNLQFPDKYIGTVLDAEAMAPGMDSATVSGHIGAQDGRDTSFIYFKVFDLIQEGTLDITSLDWKFRRMKLTQLLDEFALVFGNTNITTSKGQTYPVVDSADKFDNGLFRLTKYTIRNKVDFHNEIVARKGEGTMWKNINAQYKEGARPANNWYKWKKQDTADVVIVGFTPGKGKYENQIGAVRYAEFLTEEEAMALGIKKPHSDHMFKDNTDYYLTEIGQCSGMTDEQRLDFTNNQGAYLGRVMEVEFMERTSKGALRHPRFISMRDDKQAADCLYSNQK